LEAGGKDLAGQPAQRLSERRQRDPAEGEGNAGGDEGQRVRERKRRAGERTEQECGKQHEVDEALDAGPESGVEAGASREQRAEGDQQEVGKDEERDAQRTPARPRMRSTRLVVERPGTSGIATKRPPRAMVSAAPAVVSAV